MSDYLFAHPSFFSGMARTLDLGGQFDDYNVSDTPAQADTRAFRADWLATGNDLRAAMRAASDELPNQPEQ